MGGLTTSVVRACIGLGWAVVNVACSDDGDASPVPAAEPRDSRPGIVQVGDEEGPLLTEAQACERFRSGWASHRERLGCTIPELAPCPELIRPLASTECVSYSERSLDACLERFDAADSCDDVVPGVCVLVAVLGVLSPDCSRGEDASAGDAAIDDASAGDAHAEGPDAQTGTTSAGPALDGGETLTGTTSAPTLDASPATTSPASASSDSASSDTASSDSAANPDASGSSTAEVETLMTTDLVDAG